MPSRKSSPNRPRAQVRGPHQERATYSVKHGPKTVSDTWFMVRKLFLSSRPRGGDWLDDEVCPFGKRAGCLRSSQLCPKLTESTEGTRVQAGLFGFGSQIASTYASVSAEPV